MKIRGIKAQQGLKIKYNNPNARYKSRRNNSTA